MKKFLGIVLIILGISLAAYPYAKNAFDQYNNDQRIKQLEEAQKQAKLEQENADINSDGGENKQGLEAQFPQYSKTYFTEFKGYVGPDDIVNSESPQTNMLLLYFDAPELQAGEDDLKYLGTLEIPSIDLNMPLVEGTTDKDIAISAGHMITTAYPGQIGNCVIVGHRGYSFGRLFNRLDELGPGDEIIVNVGSEQYKYEVYLSKVVLPTDTSVTNQTNKAKVLTLVTCTPLFSSEYRLIIHSKIK